MARERAGYREVLAAVTGAFPKAELIPLRQAADYLGINYRTLIADPDFPVKTIGRMYYVPRTGLARWLS